MSKLRYSIKEAENIKTLVYFTDDELQIFEMWLREKSIIEMSLKLNLSTATISRRKKSIKDKISRALI